MQKNREILPISVLKDIGLSISQSVIDADRVEAKYSSVLEEFVETVCDNMTKLHIKELDEGTFNSILCTTVLMESVFHDLDEKIPAKELAIFTSSWSVALFTDLLGEWLEDVWNNIEKMLRRDSDSTETEWWTDAENECCARQESGNCTHGCEECDCF